MSLLKKIYSSVPLKFNEISRFLLISLMMLMILFIYSIQRNIKDAIIVSDISAEIIPTIKLWVVTPLAVLFLFFYAQISNSLNKTVIFHILNLFFISYFLFFAFVIQQNLGLFHFNLGLESFKEGDHFFKYFILVLENWSYVVYFAFAELWGSVMLGLMFWQIANQVFRVDESKRLYPLFGLLAQFGLFLSSFVIKFSKYLTKSWEQQLVIINICVAIAAIILSLTFKLLYSTVVKVDDINAETTRRKRKMSLSEGLKHVFTSKYIGLIAVLIICYGVSMNLVEVLWKAQISAIYSDKSKYSNYIANSQIYIGMASMIIMLLGSYVLRLVSWRVAATINPIIIGITGLFFFAFTVFKDHLYLAISFFSISPLSFTIAVGLIQNVLSKSTKYAFFDATKEMAYIPLDNDLKSKGKAAAEVIGGRFGKGGGSFILWFLLGMPNTTAESITPIVFFIFIFIIVIWFFSIRSLSLKFDKKTS